MNPSKNSQTMRAEGVEANLMDKIISLSVKDETWDDMSDCMDEDACPCTSSCEFNSSPNSATSKSSASSSGSFGRLANRQRPRLESRSSSLVFNRPKLMSSSFSERSLGILKEDQALDNVSVHTQRTHKSIEELREWSSLDSIHSRVSSSAYLDDDEGSSDFNESGTSFASFGGSDDSANNDDVAATVASKQFTKLAEAPTPRQVLMKQQSYRMTRGASFRGSLSLIQESSSD